MFSITEEWSVNGYLRLRSSVISVVYESIGLIRIEQTNGIELVYRR